MTQAQTQPRRPIAGPGIPMTQDQIAQAVGVSRSRIQYIEARAMRKIREALILDGFDPDFEIGSDRR